MRAVRFTQEMIDYYTTEGYWDDRTWTDIYDGNALKYPEKVAFVDTRERVTWLELKSRYDNLALALRQIGFERDDRIIVQLPNCIENIVFHMACEKAGLIRVFAALNIGESELDQFIEHTQAAGAVFVDQVGSTDFCAVWSSFKKKYPHLKLFVKGKQASAGSYLLSKLIAAKQGGRVEDLKETTISSNEVSLVMATTGTTGLPKLVEYTANCCKAHGKNYLQRWNINKDDYCFITAFLWTGPSMGGIYAAPQVGAACLFMEAFDPLAAMELVEKEKPTYFSGFPVHLINMARHPDFEKYNLGSFRFLSHGGAPFPRGVVGEVEEKFGAPLLTYYGSLDSLATLAVDLDAPQETRFSSVGKPPPGSEVKLLNEEGMEVPHGEIGEVHVRGPMCCGGYYRDPEKTRQAWCTLGLEGWFNIEDLGRFLENGSLMLTGRKKDIILRGGQNIFPAEIEGFLNGYSKVLNVAVVSMPDPKLGERACAFVIPVAGETVTLEEITSFLREKKVAKYKWPERLEVVAAFPMLGDKVNKRALQEDIVNKLRDEG